ncbi:hypothetical protein K449DRAFT_437278 [Hypoxylon sp. EC38]|nr:hypothetical protein K449DRAFT_437278 [Hypoxylon sp. EC38]
MNTQQASAPEREMETKVEPSKYFPRDGVLYSHPMDEDAFELMTRLAEYQVKDQACKGIPIIRLWLDAHAAEDPSNAADSYQQYLVIVRKTAGRLLAQELQGQQVLSVPAMPAPGVMAKGGHDGEASTSAQAPKAMFPELETPALGKLNPQAKPFSPSTSASKQTLRPDETKSAEDGLACFEERCKKLGLRVSSANKN